MLILLTELCFDFGINSIGYWFQECSLIALASAATWGCQFRDTSDTEMMWQWSWFGFGNL